MNYSDVVMDHFWRPRNARVMRDAHVVAAAGSPGSGPFVLLYLKLEGTKVLEASFQTNGCPPCIAAGSLLAAELPGADVCEAQAAWSEAAINAALGGLPEHKRHCSALAAEALTRASEEAARRIACPDRQDSVSSGEVVRHAGDH